jgi:peptidyl-prolyl cis-trans isomerase D
LPRTGGGGAVPPALVAKLFEAKPGAAVTAPAGEGYAVAQLKEIQPADPAKDPAAVAQLKGQVGNVMQNDMLDEFDQALRQRFPVEVNQAKLDQLL